MSKAIKLPAHRRAQGTRLARRLRRDGRIPAVIYGPGLEPVAVAVDALLLNRVVNRGGVGQVAELNIEGDPGGRPVLLKSYTRDPITQHLMHVDFMQVDMSQPTKLIIPIRMVNEEAARKKGMIAQLMLQEVEMEGLPADLPSYLTVDARLAVDEDRPLTVADLPVPAGGQVLADAETVVLSLSVPRRPEEAEAEPGTEAGADAGADGEGPGDTPAE